MYYYYNKVSNHRSDMQYSNQVSSCHHFFFLIILFRKLHNIQTRMSLFVYFFLFRFSTNTVTLHVRMVTDFS